MAPDAEPTPRHIAYVVTRFPKLSETFVLDEIVALERRGWTVDVHTLILETESVIHADAVAHRDRARSYPWWGAAAARALWHWTRTEPAMLARTLATVVAGMARSPKFLLRTLALIPQALTMARAIQASGATQLHAHFATHATTAAWIVSRLTGLPYTFTCHATDVYVDRTFLVRKVGDAAAVITISDDGGETVRRVVDEHDREKVQTVRLGVDCDALAFRTPSAPSASGEIRVLSVARLDPMKGLTDLVRAAALLAADEPSTQFDIIGDGEQRAELTSLISELGVGATVTLLGPQPRDEVRRHLDRADMFVLPAVREPNNNSDGIPVALMEAMALGVPVISTDVGGIAELVIDGATGRCVPPGDPGALAAAITALGGDQELREQLATGARRHVEREFNRATNVDALISVLGAI